MLEPMALLVAAQVPPEAAVMVGDDVCDDVGGAMACGMAGLLGELLRCVADCIR